MAGADPAILRWHQALYHYRSFRRASGPPHDYYFEMASCFDAFLWALASVRDLCTPAQRDTLDKQEVFAFILGARHATTHQGVLAAPKHVKLPGRPFSRVLQIGADEGAYLRIELDW